jgi:phosphoenolpyruvate phosphomutase
MTHSNSAWTSNDERRGKLRLLLNLKNCIRLIEAHNPISAILAERVQLNENDIVVEYDGFWSSSLTDSTARGKPDNEILNIQSRLTNIREIFEVTTKPLIIDADTGGQPEHFASNIRSLEMAGVSAVIIEDKKGLKKNSLFGLDVPQQQNGVEEFCHKIRSGKAAQQTADFMVIGRIESFILNAGLDDALMRAQAYVAAGADGIMIHSKKTSADEVLEFARNFKRLHPGIPLVCVPTTYTEIHFSKLQEAGFNIVIYANHLLRAAYPAMMAVAQDILRHGRSLEAESKCMPINDLLELISGTK